MESTFNRGGGIRVLLAASALMLASCSDSDSGGSSGGSPAPAEDQAGINNPPPVTAPPVTNPPVTNPPVTNPPVSNPPVSNPPVAPPPTPPQTGSSDIEMLFGRVTFEAQFNDSNETLRFFATFSEANVQLAADGSSVATAFDTGIYQNFGCTTVPDQSALFLCLGIFESQDVNLFGFQLANGAGNGIFEECFGAEAADLQGCTNDFTQTPDGTVSVTVNAAPAARVEQRDSVLSASEFRALMDVNGQATRFGTSQAELTSSEQVLKDAAADLWSNLQSLGDR